MSIYSRIPMLLPQDTYDSWYFLRNFLPFQEGQKICKRYTAWIIFQPWKSTKGLTSCGIVWHVGEAAGKVSRSNSYFPKTPSSQVLQPTKSNVSEHRSRPPADQRTAEVRVQCRQCPEAARDWAKSSATTKAWNTKFQLILSNPQWDWFLKHNFSLYFQILSWINIWNKISP